MIRATPLLLAFALLGGGCQALTAPPVAELGEPFWLDYGHAVVIPTTAGTIRFSKLFEDSRCPADPGVLCVWAGRVRLQVTVALSEQSHQQVELRLLDAQDAAVVAGFVIRLLAVDPQASVQHPPRVADYRAQLLITAFR